MRYYSLFLDESGDFQEDKYPSLIGGYLICNTNALFCNSLRIQELFNNELWGHYCGYEAFEDIHHATDVKRDNFLRGGYSSAIKKLLIKLNDNNGVPVICFTKKNAKILTDEITYLNILAEGICNVLTVLCKYNKEKIHLDIVLGGRYSSDNGRYTSINDYIDRIKEKIAIYKINFNIDAEVDIKLGDDKSNYCLVVSDYICNYAFSEFIKRDNTLVSEIDKKQLNQLFENEYRYELGENYLNNKLTSYVNSNNYENLMLFYCCHENDGTSINDETFRNRYLTNLSYEKYISMFRYIVEISKRIITIERQLDFGEKILSRAYDLFNILVSKQLLEKDITTWKIFLDIILLQETIYSHKGDMNHQREKIDIVNKGIHKIKADRKVYSEMMSMAKNREALYYMLAFDFEKADSICSDEEKRLETLLQFMGDDNDNNYKDEQLAKIYGTHLQIAMHEYKYGLIDFEGVWNLCENAIKRFDKENDKKRQYQYFSKFECIINNKDAAINCLKLAFDIKNIDKDCIDKINDPFFYYHISNVCLMMAKNGDIKEARTIYELIEEKVKIFNEKSNKELREINIMPNIITRINLAIIRLYLNKCISNGETKLLEELLNVVKQSNISFCPSLYAEVALCMLKNNESHAQEYIEETIQSIEFINNNGYMPESVKSFYAPYTNIKVNDMEKIEYLAKARLY